MREIPASPSSSFCRADAGVTPTCEPGNSVGVSFLDFVGGAPLGTLEAGGTSELIAVVDSIQSFDLCSSNVEVTWLRGLFY